MQTRKIIVHTVAFLLEKQSSYAVVKKLAKLMLMAKSSSRTRSRRRQKPPNCIGKAIADDTLARRAAPHEDKY